MVFNGAKLKDYIVRSRASYLI